jgi:hypothetical protein
MSIKNKNKPFIRNLKGLLSNKYFQKNILILGSVASGKSTFLYGLIKENLKNSSQIVLIDERLEEETRNLFFNYDNAYFKKYEENIDYQHLLKKYKNRTLFLIVNFSYYIFQEDEVVNEIVSEINNIKSVNYNLKIYVKDCERIGFLDICKEQIKNSDIKNIDYICESQKFKNSNLFDVKLVFNFMATQGFKDKFSQLEVGEFKVIKNKRIDESFNSKTFFIKNKLRNF